MYNHEVVFLKHGVELNEFANIFKHICLKAIKNKSLLIEWPLEKYHIMCVYFRNEVYSSEIS